MRAFLTIPFFRILVPFLLGIGIGICYEPGGWHWMYLSLLLVIMGGITFYGSTMKRSALIALVIADVFLLVYGWTLVDHSRSAKQPLYYGKEMKAGKEAEFIAVIDDLPVAKEKFIKCSLKMLEIRQDSAYKPASGRIIAYLRRSATDTALQPGKILLIRATLSEPEAPKNPYEFDYKTYLLNRQVVHTAFVNAGAYALVPGDSPLNIIWEIGLTCKSYVLKQLKNSPLSGTSYAICSALLTGYDNEIDRSVMESFSHSGTLHVLSVSGLHTGLIYLALGFLFDLADRRKKYKLLKFVFISAVLWFFALLTGFSAPVLRAVIMFSLLGLGRIYFRNDYRNQVNILCVSAFILLSYDPFFIADIGFQLSYFALFGLIYFQPRLSQRWQPRSFLVNSVWQSVTASVAATVSTLPLTLVYFKQFPLWFFVCNIVVVPATFILLLLALLVVMKLNAAALIINYLVTALVWFIDLFNSERYGFIDRIDFQLTDAIFLSCLLVIISTAIQYRSYKQLAAAFVVLIVWQCHALFTSYQTKDQLVFTVYQAGKEQVVSLKNKTVALVTPADPANYNYHVKPHITSFNNSLVSVGEFNYVAHGSLKVLLLHRPGYWPAFNVREVTTLVLGNNFKLKEADLNRFEKLESIVVNGSNNRYTVKKTEELSRKFGLSFYDTKSRGAYLVDL